MNSIWKRSLSMMMAVLMVFSLLPVNVLAADTESAEEHTHAYASAVTAEATCTEDGVLTYTCDCGDSYTDAIAAAGHTYTDGVCSCGAADPDYVAPVPEHTHAYVDGVCECGEADLDYVAPTPVPTLSGDVRKVYFVNAEDWDAVYVAWSFDEEYFEDRAFPGAKLSGKRSRTLTMQWPV